MKKYALSFVAVAALALCAFGAAEMTLNGGALAGPTAKTTILSQTLEMVSSDTANTFYFSQNVRVRSTNLFVTADKMVVTALRANSDASASDKGNVANIVTPKVSVAAKPSTDAKTDTPLGTIDTIVATGNVHISQQDREATAGHAEFFPKEGRVVLTDNPRVVDSKAVVSGWRITLLHDERRVLVEQDPNGTARPNVDLNNMPDMGVPAEPKPAATSPSKPEAAAPSATVLSGALALETSSKTSAAIPVVAVPAEQKSAVLVTPAATLK